MAPARVATFHPFGAFGRPYAITSGYREIPHAIEVGLYDKPGLGPWLQRFVLETAR